MHSLPERREISPRHYAYIIAGTHFVIERPRTRVYIARRVNVATIRVTLKPRLSAQREFQFVLGVDLCENFNEI